MVEVDYDPRAWLSPWNARSHPMRHWCTPSSARFDRRKNLAGRPCGCGVCRGRLQCSRELSKFIAAHQVPMETRGLVALPEGQGSGFFQSEIIASDPIAYRLRDSLAEMSTIRRGRSGSKLTASVAVSVRRAAFMLRTSSSRGSALRAAGRCVGWKTSASISQCARQERDQIHQVSVAFAKSGKIIGLKDKFTYDVGAYSTTIIIPWTTAYTLVGSYKIPNLRIQMQLAFTTKFRP